MAEDRGSGLRDFLGAVTRPTLAPGALYAALGGLIAAGLLFLAGLVVAVLTADSSLFHFGSEDIGLVTEGFAQASLFTLTGTQFSGDGFDLVIRFTPALFAVFPLAFSALAAVLLKPLVEGSSTRSRLIAGAAIGLPFAIAVLVFALVVGDVETDDGDEASIEAVGAFFLALLWGALGGVTGAWLALGKDARHRAQLRPEWLREGGRTLLAMLKPLGACLLIMAVIGTGAWIVQTLRDAGDVQSGGADTVTAEGLDLSDEDAFEERPTFDAAVEDALYFADHGVHWFEFSSGVAFHAPTVALIGGVPALGMPLPVRRVDEVVDFDPLYDYYDNGGEEIAGERVSTEQDAIDTFFTPPVTFRNLDYEDALPTWAYILLLVLVVIPVVAAVYAGFATARTRGAAGPGPGAAWGSLVGITWALALLILNALVQKDVMGKAEMESVFVIPFVAGTALGAIGGLLGGQRRAR